MSEEATDKVPQKGTENSAGGTENLEAHVEQPRAVEGAVTTDMGPDFNTPLESNDKKDAQPPKDEASKNTSAASSQDVPNVPVLNGLAERRQRQPHQASQMHISLPPPAQISPSKPHPIMTEHRHFGASNAAPRGATRRSPTRSRNTSHQNPFVGNMFELSNEASTKQKTMEVLKRCQQTLKTELDKTLLERELLQKERNLMERQTHNEAALRESNETLTGERNRLMRQLHASSGECDTLKRRCATLQADLKEALEKHAREKGKLESDREQLLRRTKDELAALQNDFIHKENRYIEEITRLEGKMTEEVNRNRERVEESAVAMEKLVNKSKSERMDLTSKYDSEREEFLATFRVQKELIDKLLVMKEQFERSTREKTRLEQRHEMDDMQKTIWSLQQTTIEMKNCGLRETNEQLTTENRELKRKCDLLTAENQTLRTETEWMRTEYQTGMKILRSHCATQLRLMQTKGVHVDQVPLPHVPSSFSFSHDKFKETASSKNVDKLVDEIFRSSGAASSLPTESVGPRKRTPAPSVSGSTPVVNSSSPPQLMSVATATRRQSPERKVHFRRSPVSQRSTVTPSITITGVDDARRVFGGTCGSGQSIGAAWSSSIHDGKRVLDEVNRNLGTGGGISNSVGMSGGGVDHKVSSKVSSIVIEAAQMVADLQAEMAKTNKQLEKSKSRSPSPTRGPR